MIRMMTYQEANEILKCALTPVNYCICKLTALANHAKPEPLVNFEYNRLIPASRDFIQLKTYTITFVDHDGTILSRSEVTRNQMPTPPANPTWAGHTFTGWHPAIVAATQDQTYTAQYDAIPTYTVTIQAIGTGGYILYNDPQHVSENIRNNRKDYSVYENDHIGAQWFADNGWHVASVTENGVAISGDAMVADVTGNITLIVTFEQDTPSTYTISWYNDAVGVGTLIETTTVNAGTVPTHSAPTKSGYTFTGWKNANNLNPYPADKNESYYAQFTLNTTYTIRFFESSQFGGALIGSTQTVAAGGTVTEATHPSHSGYDWAGWSPAFSSTANASVDYTATYTQSQVTTYTIRFLNSDNTVLETKTVSEGVVPEYTGSGPSHPTNPNSYEFSGWDPTPYAANKNQDYIATYTAKTYSYNQTIGAAYVSQGSSLESIPLIVEPYMMSWPTGKTVTINASGWVGTESSHTSVSGTITISFNGAASTTATVSGTLSNYLEFESATSAVGVKFRMINPSAETGVMITSYSMNTYITKNPSESSGWKNEHTNIEELPDFYSKIVIAASQAA